MPPDRQPVFYQTYMSVNLSNVTITAFFILQFPIYCRHKVTHNRFAFAIILRRVLRKQTALFQNIKQYMKQLHLPILQPGLQQLQFLPLL
jgi:hypothetical protein